MGRADILPKASAGRSSEKGCYESIAVSRIRKSSTEFLYAEPRNARINETLERPQRVIFVDEPDDSNRLGMKGLGEIGIVGVAAAIANAVYHATGKRVRDLPITLDKLQR